MKYVEEDFHNRKSIKKNRKKDKKKSWYFLASFFLTFFTDPSGILIYKMPVFKDLFGCITIFPRTTTQISFGSDSCSVCSSSAKSGAFTGETVVNLMCSDLIFFFYLFPECSDNHRVIPICRYCSARRILLFLPARIRYVTMDVMIDATITSANMIKTRNDVCIDKTSLKYMDFKTILSDLDAMMQADFT